MHKQGLLKIDIFINFRLLKIDNKYPEYKS
jgi:hypothetical protein